MLAKPEITVAVLIQSLISSNNVIVSEVKSSCLVRCFNMVFHSGHNHASRTIGLPLWERGLAEFFDADQSLIGTPDPSLLKNDQVIFGGEDVFPLPSAVNTVGLYRQTVKNLWKQLSSSLYGSVSVSQ